ncbi:MAG: thiamine phosphate synthase, partial [Planctomycetes bacterium]|nr:thiamine phosphate synthase [Planctomycetota bacterium]
GLSAETANLFDYIRSADVGEIDYFGAGPLHETQTKPDCGTGPDGKVSTRTFEDFARLAECSPRPVVVGGGVKLDDIPPLATTGIDGFFVVSAIAGADDPEAEAKKMIQAWKANIPADRTKL